MLQLGFDRTILANKCFEQVIDFALITYSVV